VVCSDIFRKVFPIVVRLMKPTGLPLYYERGVQDVPQGTCPSWSTLGSTNQVAAFPHHSPARPAGELCVMLCYSFILKYNYFFNLINLRTIPHNDKAKTDF
jgi:hypothetical protein